MTTLSTEEQFLAEDEEKRRRQREAAQRARLEEQRLAEEERRRRSAAREGLAPLAGEGALAPPEEEEAPVPEPPVVPDGPPELPSGPEFEALPPEERLAIEQQQVERFETFGPSGRPPTPEELASAQQSEEADLLALGRVLAAFAPALVPPGGQRVTLESAIETYNAFVGVANRNPDFVLNMLFEKGRTPDTEMLLALFSVNGDRIDTPEELDEFFAGAPEPEAEFTPQGLALQRLFPDRSLDDILALSQADNAAFNEQLELALGLLPATPEKVSLLRDLGFSDDEIEQAIYNRKMVVDINGESKLVTVRFSSNFENVVIDEMGQTLGFIDPATGKFEPYQYILGGVLHSWSAGVGDIYAVAAGTAKWLGQDGIGESLSKKGEFLQLQAPPDTLGEFSWEHLYNPRFWATRVSRSLAFPIVLIPAAVVGAAAGGWVAGAASLGAFGSFVLGALGAGISSRVVEGALEAGATYNKAIANDFTEEQASEAANKVFLHNQALVVGDALQFAAAFAPTPVRVFNSLIAKGLVTTARFGGKVFITGLTEGGEEVVQEALQRIALGQPVTWDAELKEAFAIGGIMGVGLGAGGAVYTSIKSKVIEALPSDLKIQFDQAKQDAVAQGLSEPHAEEKGLDAVMDDKRAQDIVTAAVEVAKIDALEQEIKPKTEADKLAWEHTFATLRGPAGGLLLGTGRQAQAEAAAPVAAQEPAAGQVTPPPAPAAPVSQEELPTLTAQLREAHKFARIEIDRVRELLREGPRRRDPAVKLQNLLLKSGLREIAEADVLVRKIERNETLTAREIATLQGRIERLKEKSTQFRAKMETIAERRQALVSYIRSNVPGAARGKLIASVNNVRTEEGLEAAIAKADLAAEGFNQRVLRRQVKQELKRAAPTREGGILRGKFTAETQRELDAIEGVAGRDRDQARAQMALNVKRADAGTMSFEEMVEQNDLLAFAGIDGMSAEELQFVLENIREIKATGRTQRKERLEALKVRLRAKRAEIIEVVTGGKGLQEANASLPASELEIPHSVLSAHFWNHMGWDNKTDAMSKLEKGEPHESRLSRFGRTVHAARTRENVGLETAQDQVTAGLTEVFGVTNKAELNQILNHMQKDKVVLGPFVNRKGQPTTIRMTKGELVKRWMELQDPTLDATFEEGMAYTDEMREAVGKGLTPQERAWGEWMLQFYQDYYQGINAVYKEIYHIDLSLNPRYSPLDRALELTKTGKDVFEYVQVLQDSARYASTLNGSLKARVENIKPLRPQDAVDVLINHIIQMEHFKAWAAPMRDLRGVLGNAEVRTAIRQYHGPDILASVDKDMNLMAQGGRDAADINKTLDGIRSRFAVASLAGKPRLLLGQVTSILAYSTQMPIGDFVTGISDFWKAPLANAKFLADNSPFYRTRYSQGYERDIRLAMERTPIERIMKTNNLASKLLLNIRIGDRIAVTQGMWAKYQSGLKKGLSQEEALREAEQATRMSQDTSEIETLSGLQNGSSWQKLLTMFQTQQNKYFRIMADNARNIKYGRGRRDKAVFNIVLLWAVLPAIFQLIIDGGRFKTERQLRAWLFGPINYALVFGQIAQSAFSWFQDEPQDPQITPVFQTLIDLKNGVAKALKVMGQIDNPYTNMNVDDLVAAVEFLAKAAGELTGLPTPYLVQVERAIREGDLRELVFTRWGLREPEPSDKAKTKLLGQQLGMTLSQLALASEDPKERKEAKEAQKKRRESIEAGLTVEPEPFLDMSKLDSRFQSVLGDTLPDDIIKDKGFSDLARAWAEMRKAQEIAGTLPNRPLYTINTDLDKDDTILQYRMQWQARQGITNLADLREFDKVYPLAFLGNVTNAQYTLLKRYMDAEDKDAFLKKHPELKVNPLTDWLKANPKENAQLALWGNAPIRTQAAYDEFQRLVASLDLPEEAIPALTLPPSESVKTHFLYLDAVDERSANSWEAQLLLAKAPAYVEWRGFKPPETPIAALELLVKDRALYDEEQRLRDALEGEDLEAAIAKLRKANPLWVDNQRRVEALRLGSNEAPTAAAFVEGWVERGRVTDQHTAGAAESLVWLADHEDVYRWALDNKLLTDPGGLPGGEWNIPSLRITAQYRAEDKQYNETIPARYQGTLDPQERDAAIAQARARMLAANPAYRKARTTRDAYGLGLAGATVEQHVAFNELPQAGFRRDRWLKEHPDYYKNVWLNPDRLGNRAVDFSAIPDVRFDELYEAWQPQMERYYRGIAEETRLLIGEERQQKVKELRDRLFAANPGFFEDRIRYEAYGNMVPAKAIDGYVSYYSVLYKGKPQGWDAWWADDRVLRDNPAFYAYALQTLGWEPRDFSTLPSVEFERLYNTVYIALRHDDGTADRRAREKMRATNKEFDLQGVIAGLWEPYYPTPRQEIADLVRRLATR